MVRPYPGTTRLSRIWLQESRTNAKFPLYLTRMLWGFASHDGPPPIPRWLSVLAKPQLTGLWILTVSLTPADKVLLRGYRRVLAVDRLPFPFEVSSPLLRCSDRLLVYSYW